MIVINTDFYNSLDERCKDAYKYVLGGYSPEEIAIGMHIPYVKIRKMIVDIRKNKLTPYNVVVKTPESSDKAQKSVKKSSKKKTFTAG